MDASLTYGWKVSIANDNMSATINITPSSSGSLTPPDVTAYLQTCGVTAGIQYSVIEDMINRGLYYQDIVVAKGADPVNGENGSFEFHVRTSEISHPTIRMDGSVDYQSMTMIQSVQKGQKIVTYHPADPGKHGYDVRGREIRCKMGKEQVPLRGTGFEMSPDGLTYYAALEGRVEYTGNKLYVRDVYELRGDLDLVRGRIDFRGDVIVHGNVRTGTMIRASRSITVEGSVEAATLIAGGDIVLKKGMQGGQRARISSGGTVFANFLEFTDVEAKGNIEANVIMNCRISAGRDIIVSGKRGTVVGGIAYAVSSVETTFIGNPAGIKTSVGVGVSVELEKRHHLLSQKEKAAIAGIAKADAEISAVKDIRINRDPKDVRDAKVAMIQRRKLRDERLLAHIREELNEIQATMEVGDHSVVRVQNTVFPGSAIKIDDKEYPVTSAQNKVIFFRKSKMDEIEVKSC